ncbi:NAD(P)H-binding protein [Mucilaginibacter sp. dw_454]|uniref:NmrA family NAD(P)-binding protein n=1 Tax=Mucilaginibacter sp. dw_454 TaxID=2720079 RepID=UPI001BD54D60|nr:NAD(P)H-binding protein [Mucilaginibacter sp. dw_454]
MKIIVLGSLGHIGRPLTEDLVKKGHEVTVITRSADRVAEIEALGAKAAIGNVDDIDFLTKTFTGADVIHAMVPPDLSAPDPVVRTKVVGEALVQAIKQSGVQRVLYVSSYGAHLAEGTGLIKHHHFIENDLSDLNLESLVLLRATYIYYNTFAYVQMIKATGNIYTNYGGDDLVTFVSPLDIAEAAAKELVSTANGRRVVYVASDERTCNEAAKVLGNAIGKEIQWIIISDEQFKSNLEANGVSPVLSAELTELYAACHTGLLHEDYEKHKPTLGKVKLEDFAQEFAAVYNQ